MKMTVPRAKMNSKGTKDRRRSSLAAGAGALAYRFSE